MTEGQRPRPGAAAGIRPGARSDPLRVHTLLAGIAVRPLAQSARRAGVDAGSVDFFGDRDHRRSLPVLSLRSSGQERYSADALVRLSARVEAREVAYGADLENHPDLVARIGRGRRLLGNGPAVLRRVRDPRALAASLSASGLPAPRTLAPGEAPSPDAGDRAWLLKPVRGGGGRGIRPWVPGAPVPEDRYLQERVGGTPVSVLFASDGRSARLLAATEMLVGRERLGADGLTYCGSLLALPPGGPPLPPAPGGPVRAAGAGPDRGFPLQEARALVAHLARAFGLRGLNGVDGVLAGGRIWPVEVNPRWTAAMELLEPGPAPADPRPAAGEPGPVPAEPGSAASAGATDPPGSATLFVDHRRACLGEADAAEGPSRSRAARRWWSSLPLDPPSSEETAPGSGGAPLVVGKALLRARSAVRAPELDRHRDGALLADVPDPGEGLPAGGPVCTILAAGPDRDGCLARLESVAAEVRRELEASEE